MQPRREMLMPSTGGMVPSCRITNFNRRPWHTQDARDLAPRPFFFFFGKHAYSGSSYLEFSHAVAEHSLAPQTPRPGRQAVSGTQGLPWGGPGCDRGPTAPPWYHSVWLTHTMCGGSTAGLRVAIWLMRLIWDPMSWHGCTLY